MSLENFLHLISLENAVVLCYLGILLAVALIDWRTRIIPNRFHIFILLLGMAQLFLVPEHGLGERVCCLCQFPCCF